MAKSMIRNSFDNGKTYTFYVPANATDAATFAGSVLDSEYSVYSLNSTSGSDAVTSALKARCDIKQIINGDVEQRTYATFLVNTTTKEEDLQGALVGKTIEGVRADEVGVSFQSVTYGS